MNNSKKLAVVGLSGLALNAAVGMDDVISVFITRYEDKQIADRKALQAEILEVNKDIKSVVESVTAAARSAATGHEVNEDNGLFTTTVTVNADGNAISLDWDKRIATVSMFGKIKSKSHGGYHGETSGTVKIELPIEDADADRYKELMAKKTDLTDKLNQVQTNLRDVSRKERQVRGALAQKKLSEAGMDDLLNDSGLLALVDESVLNS